MFKQASLDIVGEAAAGIVETKDPDDVALDGALVRQRNSLGDTAQKAAQRKARLTARTTGWRAGRDEIPIERNTIHG